MTTVDWENLNSIERNEREINLQLVAGRNEQRGELLAVERRRSRQHKMGDMSVHIARSQEDGAGSFASGSRRHRKHRNDVSRIQCHFRSDRHWLGSTSSQTTGYFLHQQFKFFYIERYRRYIEPKMSDMDENLAQELRKLYRKNSFFQNS